jgi:hypothetical protein
MMAKNGAIAKFHFASRDSPKRMIPAAAAGVDETDLKHFAGCDYNEGHAAAVVAAAEGATYFVDTSANPGGYVVIAVGYHQCGMFKENGS